jgi:acyl dehydratase
MLSIANLIATIGTQSVSEWRQVTQDEINQYTAATRDGVDEWVHLDPKRAARETPYGGTIVQGFFQTALLTDLCSDAMRSGLDLNHALNYGFDKLRFIAPLPVGAHVRAKVEVRACTPKSGGHVVAYHVELECKETAKTTLAADWLFFIQSAALSEAGH